jgi:hypothetical protein
MACGTDEQQCDSACHAEHECSICGKSRSELAKDVADVRQHLISSTEDIIQQLSKVKNLRTLTDIVDVLANYSKKLDWLSREQLVEMAVWGEKHGHGRATVR